ncbi:organic solute transporter subunit beta [Rhinophrynus dorsalis]
MADKSQQSEAATIPSEAQKKLERAVWFFRTGDLTSWNYAILGLAICALLLGLFLLTRNILNNRKRKMIAVYQKEGGAVLPDNDATKQAVVQLEKEKDPSSLEDALLKKEPQPGDITVQWKDGQITSLYTQVPEEDV